MNERDGREKGRNESRDLQDSLEIDLYVSRNMTHRAGRAPSHFFPFSHCEPSNFLRQCSLGLQMPEFFSDIRHVGLCGRKGVYWGDFFSVERKGKQGHNDNEEDAQTNYYEMRQIKISYISIIP